MWHLINKFIIWVILKYARWIRVNAPLTIAASIRLRIILLRNNCKRIRHIRLIASKTAIDKVFFLDLIIGQLIYFRLSKRRWLRPDGIVIVMLIVEKSILNNGYKSFLITHLIKHFPSLIIQSWVLMPLNELTSQWSYTLITFQNRCIIHLLCFIYFHCHIFLEIIFNKWLKTPIKLNWNLSFQ